jgi:arylsulfatase A-like enzyme
MSSIRGLYEGEVRFTDQQIGRLFDHLKSAGLYEQALIVVFSDHGEEFGEHEKMRHGNSLYEQLLSVPWLMKVPAGSGKTLLLDSAAQHIDMMPTILGLLGSASPRQVEGVDLTSARPELLKRRVSLAYLEYGADADLVGVDATPWVRQYESATGYGYKLHLRRVDSFSPRRPLLQLFELTGDPVEKKDLSHLGKVEMGFLWAELESARRRATNSQQVDLDKTRDAFRSLPYLR